MLERLGFTVLSASNGAEGIVAFCDHDRETVAILLDLTMPVMDGEETLEERIRVRDDVPIILCSGYAAEDAFDRFAGKPIADFLHKPFSLETLAAVLRAQLEGRTAGTAGTAKAQ
ncbi:MAG: response regulator [Planctomycetota bacterium]